MAPKSTVLLFHLVNSFVTLSAFAFSKAKMAKGEINKEAGLQWINKAAHESRDPIITEKAADSVMALMLKLQGRFITGFEM